MIADCSSRNCEFVRGLGTNEVFDYNASSCAEKVFPFANGRILAREITDFVQDQGIYQ